MTMTATLAARAGIRASTSSYQVETLEDFDSFLGIEGVWNDLLERSGIAFPFATHEWVRTWIEYFGHAQRIQVLLVKSGHTVVGIVPLMLRKGWMYGLPVMRLQAIHNVYTERFDFIITGDVEQVYRAIWNHLHAMGRRWDVLELRQVPSDSPTLAHIARLAAEDRHPTERWHSCDSPYLPVQGTWESYHLTLDRKHRANLRNRMGRMGRMGKIQVEVIEDGERARAILAEGWALEAAAWKGQAGTAISCIPEVRAFYETFAARAARRGWLRLYFLKVDERRIAFCYGLCFRNRSFLLKPGYDPRFAAYSPSTALCSRMIEEAFRHGHEEFDFLGVSDGWKHAWTPSARPHEWLFVFRPGLRSRLLRWAKFRMAPALRRARRVS